MTVNTPISVRLKVQPWFQDHCFNGRVILAAVEAMSLLAETVQERFPWVNVRIMEDANFVKFLEIPPDEDSLDVLIETAEQDDGRILARLLTRRKLTTMTRLTVHCELLFGSQKPPEPWSSPAKESEPVYNVSAERVYRELVPIGPLYQTLCGRLSLSRDSAWGTLSVPDPATWASPLGSPFVLDGAMHAACVHGQQLVDFIPFPVGFAARSIERPTRPEEQYAVNVQLHSQTPGQLLYDLQILDSRQRVRETVLGLRMRDVANGKSRPPDWIRSDSYNKL